MAQTNVTQVVKAVLVQATPPTAQTQVTQVVKAVLVQRSILQPARQWPVLVPIGTGGWQFKRDPSKYGYIPGWS